MPSLLVVVLAIAGDPGMCLLNLYMIPRADGEHDGYGGVH